MAFDCIRDFIIYKILIIDNIIKEIINILSILI